MPLNIYRLGKSFCEIVSAGQDDLLQLGSEETLGSINMATESDNFRNKFDVVSNKHLVEAQIEAEGKKQRTSRRLTNMPTPE